MGTRLVEFLDWFSVGFHRAFLEGERWKLYLKGMGVTLQLTIAALVIGIVLGVVVAVVRTPRPAAAGPPERGAGYFKRCVQGVYHHHPGHAHDGPAAHLGLRHF